MVGGTTPLVPIINMANSIIGVGVLAMPWCFNKCGVILACCLLLFSAFLTYTSCMLLLRAAKVTKRTSYENLAYHVLGGTGKMAVELCIIGLLFCSCVSFFIIIGDLGPAIISKWLSLENTPRLRALLQVFLAVTVVVPLGLKRSVESLAAVSGLSMIFYICFTADMFLNSLYDLSLGKWTHESTMWNTKGGFVCITITTIAFSCQTVLFTIYESMKDRTIKKMQEVVKNAVTVVTTMYFVVGLCGYVTYYKQGIKGDVLLNFKPSLMSDIFQMCFTFSVALSFPLVIFPCRTSLYSMFYSQSLSHSIENPGGSGGGVYIPPGKFNMITLSIVIFTLLLGIIVQNVETVLALTGATLGSFICFILPAIIYIKTQGVPNKGTAKFILIVGLLLTVIGLYHNLQTTPNDETPILEPNFENPQPGHFKDSKEKFEAVDAAIKLPVEDQKGDVHIEPANPHPPIDLPVIPNERDIEENNPKELPVVDDQHNKNERLEHLGKDEVEKGKKESKQIEKQDVVPEKVIEELQEKQVEQEKKIEAQAEEIEILKKQHDEEEVERKEKERQDMLEKEERERKELQEKLEKEREELQKEIKDKEDAAIIEKAKEVIEQVGIIKDGLAGVPQVGDQQKQLPHLPQDTPDFGGQLPQQQQQQFGVQLPQQQFGGQPPQQQLGGQLGGQLPQLGGQPPQQQLRGQLPPLGGQPPQQQLGGQLPPLGGQPPQHQLGGQLPPPGGQLGGQLPPLGGQPPQQQLGGQFPQQQQQQPQQQFGIGLPQDTAALGQLPQQQLAFQPLAPLDQLPGVQPGQMEQVQGLQPLGQGVQGRRIAQNPEMVGGLGVDLGGPVDQGLQGGMGAQPDLKFQQNGADVPLNQDFKQVEQVILPQGLNAKPIAQEGGAQHQEKLEVKKEIDKVKFLDQQQDLQQDTQLNNGNARQERAAQKLDTGIKLDTAQKVDNLLSDEHVDGVKKNVADVKITKQPLKVASNARGNGVRENNDNGNVEDLQLVFAPIDDDTANGKKRQGGDNLEAVETGAKDNDAWMQLEKAVVDDDADDINAGDGALDGENVEQKKKIEM